MKQNSKALVEASIESTTSIIHKPRWEVWTAGCSSIGEFGNVMFERENTHITADLESIPAVEISKTEALEGIYPMIHRPVFDSTDGFIGHSMLVGIARDGVRVVGHYRMSLFNRNTNREEIYVLQFSDGVNPKFEKVIKRFVVRK